MPIRCYLQTEVLALLKMPRSTFHRKRQIGGLPFLEEIKPRVSKQVRYRAEPIDRYLEGRWRRSR